ncbi:MAG: DMT family transporter [Methylococcales bacterium]|nr:MAG: DMT family transporter [Methylococcales bacterium]
MFSILYGIASALSWGVADFAGGLASRRLSLYLVVFYGYIVGLLALFIAVALYPEVLPEPKSIIFAGLAGLLGAGSLLVLFYSMTFGQMSVAAPVSALFAAVLPIMVGIFTQGMPASLHFVGFGFALLAVVLISLGDSEQALHPESIANLSLPVLAGLGFGGSFIAMHYAINGSHSVISLMISSYTIGTLTTFFFVKIRRETFSIQRNSLGIVLAHVFFNVGGNFFYLQALKTGRFDISSALGSLYPGATVMLAWIILKERIYLRQCIGIVSALIAIMLFTM